MSPDLSERVAVAEANVRRLAEDVRNVRASVHDLRATLQPSLTLVDRHEQLLGALKARGPAAALWLGVAASVVAAAGALWLAWSTARAQPDPQVLAQAVAAELKRGR